MNDRPSTGIGPEQQTRPEPAIVILDPTTDGMELSLTFQKAVGAPTANPVFEEVMALLEQKGVTTGVNEVALRALCARPAFDRPFVIAKGREPRTGADGSLHYLVETKRELRPKIGADGTADFRDIGFVQNAVKGDPLCEIHLAQKGEDGVDIYGNVREGRYGKEPANPAGRNTYTNDEGTMLYAAVDGNVEVRHGVIDVMDVLTVDGSVDNSTGNINFVGDVVVKGDVLAGFYVTTKGNITVKGSVEGAVIEAAGDIYVAVGINGMNRGSVVAGGNIKCQYIQSCFIKAGGDIYADSVVYCTLECGGNLELSGKRAALIGGRSSVTGVLAAKTIGTEAHAATILTMASVGSEVQQEINTLEEEVKKLEVDLQKLMQLMGKYEDLIKQKRIGQEEAQKLIAIRDSYMAGNARKEEIARRRQEIRLAQQEATANSHIECKNRIHAGVQINFGPLVMNVKQSFVNSRIFILEENIVVRPL